MVNKVILLGNIGKDAESVSDKVTRFSVATTESWKDKDGNRQEKTEWHRVVVYGKIAPVLAELCKKGRKAYVEGKLVTNEWEKDGEKRYTTEVVVDVTGKVDVFGGEPNGQPRQQVQGKRADSPAPHVREEPKEPILSAGPDRSPEPPADAYPDSDDDIPF